MIEVAGLSKRFGKTQAVAGLSFRVEPGTVTDLASPSLFGERKVIVVRGVHEAAERLVASGITDAVEVERAVTAFLSAEPLARPEVVALRDPGTLETIQEIGDKPVLLLLFVRFGTTKLLDNRVIAAKSAHFAKVA